MNAREYIIQKQINWANNRGLDLIGSKGERGRHAYVEELSSNFFIPFSTQTEAELRAGDGGELSGVNGAVSKMQALHSSSALGVNIFEYWRQNDLAYLVAAECGLCRRGTKKDAKIFFEKKYEVSSNFRKSPNIDVVIENGSDASIKAFGIECKFSEAYSGIRDKSQKGLKSAYLGLADLWDDIPALRRWSEEISPQDQRHKHLDAAQLIKHILGLKKRHGKKSFRLLYLWYDALGPEASEHRNEIENFAEIAKADDVKFHALTYQELIVKMANRFRDEHIEYVSYMSGRYL